MMRGSADVSVIHVPLKPPSSVALLAVAVNDPVVGEAVRVTAFPVVPKARDVIVSTFEATSARTPVEPLLIRYAKFWQMLSSVSVESVRRLKVVPSMTTCTVWLNAGVPAKVTVAEA